MTLASKKRIWISFLCLVLSVNIFSQKIKVEDLGCNGCELKFPLIISTDKEVAQKLNTFLSIKLLNILPGSFQKSPFEKVNPDGKNVEATGTVDFFYYEVELNAPTIFTLCISGEATGAYSENFDTEYSFNAMTGDVIFPEDIFTPSGYTIIKNVVHNHKVERIKNYLKYLDNQLKTNKFDVDKNYTEGQKSLYEDCLKWDSNEFYYSSFKIIKNRQVVFKFERCACHAVRALDTLDSFKDTLKLDFINDKLTQYGKALLYGDIIGSLNIPPPTCYGKFVKGLIGLNVPITCLLDRPEYGFSYSIPFWFDDKRVLKKFLCKIVGNNLQLNYFGDYNSLNTNMKASIQATIGNKSIDGIWFDKRFNKKYPFKLFLNSQYLSK